MIIFGIEEATGKLSQAQIHRNKTRVKVLRAFESMQVWCLPRLHEVHNDYRSNGKGYLSKIQQMRMHMGEQIQVAKKIVGQTLSARRLTDMMGHLAHALNVSDDAAINPTSLMGKADEEEATRHLDSMLKEATERFELLVKGEEGLLQMARVAKELLVGCRTFVVK